MEAKVADLEAYRATVAREKQTAMDRCMLDTDAQQALTEFQGI
jgi:hypothetical protein